MVLHRQSGVRWGIAGSWRSSPESLGRGQNSSAARPRSNCEELLALYKQPKPGEVFVDSQDTEDSGGTARQLRKVDTDDLYFSWANGSGGSPPKKKANAQQAPMQKEATVQKQATAQVQLTRHIAASCLIEALSSEPSIQTDAQEETSR